MTHHASRLHATRLRVVSGLVLSLVLAARPVAAQAPPSQTPPNLAPQIPGAPLPGAPNLAPMPSIPHGPTEPGQMVEPPTTLPKLGRGERVRNLDFLFGALKVAPDDDSAKLIEDRIWGVWMASGSDTTNLLMARVKAALDGKDNDLALKLLDAIIEIKPDYTEALNRRATVFYAKRDYSNSVADITRVLAREPRHFGALSGLGMIMQEIGDDKLALEAYRKALAVHPRLKGVEDKVKALAQKVEGRDI